MFPAAAIDIGSNAVRMLIASASPAGRLVTIENHREPIRLGADVFSESMIMPATIDRLIGAFERFKANIERLRVSHTRAVATSALREARNREEVMAAVLSRTGIRIELIPGEEEARLVYRAVAAQSSLRGKVTLLIDIGGGSIEVSVVADGVIVLSESLKMGTVRLLQLLEERTKGAKIFARLVHEYVDGMRRQLKREIGNRLIGRCIGTGGNIETLGELRKRLLGKGDDRTLTRKELDTLYRRLERLSIEERIATLNLRPDRADVILPAAILLQHVMKHTKVNAIEIPHVGLKEGVLVEFFESRTGKRAGDPRKQVVAYATEIGRKFGFDEAHGLQVASLAVRLFDECARMHELKGDSRLLLEIAAMLHDVGQFIHQHDHHKHSFYLLRATPFVGLNAEQRLIVALVARYHRKSHPKSDHEGYGDLEASERVRVKKLAALLRVADSLDCQHAGYVNRLSVRVGRENVQLGVKAEGDLLLERWALRKKADLFREVFKRECVLED